MLKSALAFTLPLALACGTAWASATPGQPAPAFSLADLNGKTVSLADFKGKKVVLEWNNPHCPFVVKHYGSGNMQSLQNKYDLSEVAWISINSTAASHQDYMKPAALKTWLAEQKAQPDAYLMDVDGKVGRQYGAKTTPHMYVIDEKGTLIYNGAIDNTPSADPADVKTAKNHVVAALADAKAGKPVSLASSAPYGCNVKYN